MRSIVRTLCVLVCLPLAGSLTACAPLSHLGPPRPGEPALVADARKRAAEDYVWRCQQITNTQRIPCMDSLPARVPGYFGPRTNPFDAPEPLR